MGAFMLIFNVIMSFGRIRFRVLRSVCNQTISRRICGWLPSGVAGVVLCFVVTLISLSGEFGPLRMPSSSVRSTHRVPLSLNLCGLLRAADWRQSQQTVWVSATRPSPTSCDWGGPTGACRGAAPHCEGTLFWLIGWPAAYRPWGH